MKLSVNYRVGTAVKQVSLVAIAAMSLALPAYASPQGAQVVHGQASISQSGGNTTIHAGNDAIINYSQFNVGANESVHFVQPSASSRVLNRVTGSDPSHIAGSLSANGIVYLVNPAGIYFAQGARINVAGLYAAAGHMTNEDFLGHIDLFKGLSGSVVNNGTIQGNTVSLLGRYVANRGEISVPHGTLTMLAGHSVYMTQVGGHIMVKLDGKALDGGSSKAHPGVTPSLASNPGVDNSGTIDAKGSQVTLGAGDMYSLAVRNSGAIHAGSGTVTVASRDGVIDNAGHIDASGATAGSVSVAGPHIVNTGSLAASSTTGDGGEVSVVGSQDTLLLPGSSIAATGVNGGHVVVNTTDGLTDFAAGSTIDVSGIEQGGFAEVSGHQLAFAGSVDLGGATAGQLLLDPYDLVVGTGSPNQTLNYVLLGGVPNYYVAFSPSTPNTTVYVQPSALTSISSGVVTLEATHNLTVDSALAMNSSTSLTLYAKNDLTVNQNIDHAASLTLKAGYGAATGNLIINAPLTNIQGQVLLAGHAINLNTNTISSLGVQKWDSSHVMLGADSTLSASNVLFLTDTIDGAHSLKINGNASFGAPIGATTPLGSLTVTGQSSVRAGTITTTGNQTYGNVIMHSDTTFNGSNMDFGGTLDGNYNVYVNAKNNIAFDGAVGGRAVPNLLSLTYGGLTYINGSGLHAAGDITFNSGGHSLGDVATIAAPNGDVSVVSDNGSIVMGANEKFTDVGNLTLSATNGSIQLGDVSTFGNLTVNSPAITIYRRAAGQVLLSNGTVINDSGTDLISSGTFAFSSAPTFVGGGNDPIFASPTANADVNGNLGVSVLPNDALAHSSYFYLSTVLDLTHVTTNLSSSLPTGAGPEPLTDYVPEPVLLGPTGQNAIGQLALNVQPFSTTDLQAKLIGHQTINDMGYTPVANGVNATVFRVDRGVAHQVIAQYQSLFQAAGQGGVQQGAETIRGTLSVAWKHYSKMSKQPTGAGLAGYIVHGNSQKQALAYLQQLQTLIRTLDGTGLTAMEVKPIENHILASVKPKAMSLEQLRQAVQAAFTMPTQAPGQPSASTNGTKSEQQADAGTSGQTALARD